MRDAPTRSGKVARAIGTACLLAATVGGCGRSKATPEQVCSNTQSVRIADLTGSSLPLKTLALTFDDGPGARTAELSSYLRSEGIRAGFFVNGRMLTRDTQVLTQIIADGHVIGNHTQTHVSLTGRSTGAAHLDDVTTVAEIAETDMLIAPFVERERFMFRAPFGDFDEATAFAINGSSMQKYVGPINWDIGDHMGADQAADWDCWVPASDGLVLSVAECSALYLAEIDRVGRGVALLHDPYTINNDPAAGGTVDLVKEIVPVLKAKGYTFIRIDEVPDIAALLPRSSTDAGNDGDGGASGVPAPPPPSGPTGSSGGDPCPPPR